jgi:hypothetical protein
MKQGIGGGLCGNGGGLCGNGGGLCGNGGCEERSVTRDLNRLVLCIKSRALGRMLSPSCVQERIVSCSYKRTLHDSSR